MEHFAVTSRTCLILLYLVMQGAFKNSSKYMKILLMHGSEPKRKSSSGLEVLKGER